MNFIDKAVEFGEFHYSSDVLAYIGDAVFELEIRKYVLSLCPEKAGKMHKISTGFTSAVSQAFFVKKLLSEDKLEPEEIEIVKRGRNRQPKSVAKHADPLTYRWATGLEALIGYLYLSSKSKRIDELMNEIIKYAETGEHRTQSQFDKRKIDNE